MPGPGSKPDMAGYGRLARPSWLIGRGWPQLAAACGSLRRALALEEASGEPAAEAGAGLVFGLAGALGASRPAPLVRTVRGRLVRVACACPTEAPGRTCQPSGSA